jgi:putative methyltransferase (TIGR04325 family)
MVKTWLPPVVIHAVKRLRGRSIYFSGDYLIWDDAATQCSGYCADSILAKVLDASLKVKSGEAVYERDSVLFEDIQYAWPVTAGLMWAAARHGGRLNVLDFGGSLGSSYFQNRKFLNTLPDVHWGIVEQAHYVQAGQQHIQDERLRFYYTISECVKYLPPNVVLFSSTLQYIPNPLEVIKFILDYNIDFIIIDRTPFLQNYKTKVVIQHVPPEIYAATYPMWIFNEDAFNSNFKEKYNLISAFISPEGEIAMPHFSFVFKGMILELAR